MRDEQVAAVEGRVQVLDAVVDRTPPEAEVYAPVAAVSGAMVLVETEKQ